MRYDAPATRDERLQKMTDAELLDEAASFKASDGDLPF